MYKQLIYIISITGGFKEFSSLYPQHCRCQSKLPTSCTLETPDNAHKQVITHPGDWEEGGGVAYHPLTGKGGGRGQYNIGVPVYT